MRSFSSFRPVTSGSRLEVRSQTFAMWLRANIHNIKKPYDSRTWRTCKPWLSLRACKLEYRNYKNVSLGYMQIGNARLSDKEVRNAIAYEAKCQGRATTEDIQKDIETLFDYDDNVIAPGKVLKRVNELRSYRGEQVLCHSKEWEEYKETHTFHLKPKITHTELANIILKMFKPAEHNPHIHQQIQQVLLSMGQHIAKDSPIYQRAIEITGTQLEKKDTLDVIQHILRKYYKPNPHHKEPLEVMQFVVRLQTPIPLDDPNWKLVHTNISRKYNWTPEHHEMCMDDKYADKPNLIHLQTPFYKYHCRYHKWRKKQNLPWNILLKGHTRGNTTTEDTIHELNRRIEAMGYTPYHTEHPVFNIIKVQGINL